MRGLHVVTVVTRDLIDCFLVAGDSISSLTHACILLINNHGSEYKLKLCTKLSSIYIHFSMKVSRILTYQLLQTPL